VNIITRGKELLEKFQALQKEMPETITRVEGTGLLVAVHVKKDIPVVGANGLETRMRRMGINVIHGGENALRFTPHFAINSAEIDLIVAVTRKAILSMKQSSS
jgi:acetylornithine/succinyldiaminopimelate/putrescine aminotransferase